MSNSNVAPATDPEDFFYTVGSLWKWDGRRFVEIEEDDRNPSGIAPAEFKVLIRPKAVEEKTKGGIILPDPVKEQEQHAQMEGELIAVAAHAFTYASWDGMLAAPPRPGDRVLFSRYAGATVTGKDGVEYRLINDRDIGAVLA